MPAPWFNGEYRESTVLWRAFTDGAAIYKRSPYNFGFSAEGGGFFYSGEAGKAVKNFAADAPGEPIAEGEIQAAGASIYGIIASTNNPTEQWAL